MNRAIKDFWEHEFGSKEIAYDFSGLEVHKCAYGQSGSRFGWNVDHILPKSRGGTDDFNNLQITHMNTNAERGNRLTFWLDDILINGKPCQVSYQVKRASKCHNDDNVANYFNSYNGKKYCMVIMDIV